MKTIFNYLTILLILLFNFIKFKSCKIENNKIVLYLNSDKKIILHLDKQLLHIYKFFSKEPLGLKGYGYVFSPGYRIVGAIFYEHKGLKYYLKNQNIINEIGK